MGGAFTARGTFLLTYPTYMSTCATFTSTAHTRILLYSQHVILRIIGWLMRFVKNRDMAVENIVMAMAKNASICQLPPAIVQSLRQRVSEAGVRLPAGSMLRQATDIITDRGSIPGSHGVSVHATHFNCRRRRVHRPSAELKAAALRYCTSLKIAKRHMHLTTLKELTSGVRINGRSYKLGSQCQIVMPVTRSRPDLAGGPGTLKVATVHKFYTLQILDEDVVFVELSTHKEKDRFKNIRIVKKKPKTRRRIVSVDDIRQRVKFAPHWDDEITDKVCVIGMWVAL